MEENVIANERKLKRYTFVSVIMIVRWHRGGIGQSGRVRNAMAN